MFESNKEKTVASLKDKFRGYERVIKDLVSRKLSERVEMIIKHDQLNREVVENTKKSSQFSLLEKLKQRKNNQNKKTKIKKMMYDLGLHLGFTALFWVLLLIFQKLMLNPVNSIGSIQAFMSSYFISVSTIMLPIITGYVVLKHLMINIYQNIKINYQINKLQKEYPQVENNLIKSVENQKQQIAQKINYANHDIMQLELLLREIEKALTLLEKMNNTVKVDITGLFDRQTIDALTQIDKYQMLSQEEAKKRRFTK